MTMSDRIAVFDSGRIVQLGSPQEIYETPQTRFVARFVGHANLLDGRVTEIESSDRCVVALAQGGEFISAIPGPHVSVGSAVTVVLRYESVCIQQPDSPPPSHDRQVVATIQELTYMGGFQRARVQTSNGLSLVADTAVSEQTRRWTVGTQVVAGWATTDARALSD